MTFEPPSPQSGTEFGFKTQNVKDTQLETDECLYSYTALHLLTLTR